jgi:hypothetical protein
MRARLWVAEVLWQWCLLKETKRVESALQGERFVCRAPELSEDAGDGVGDDVGLHNHPAPRTSAVTYRKIKGVHVDRTRLPQ